MKMISRLALPLLFVILSGFSISLAGANRSAGATTFEEKCSMCHGQGGEGYAAIGTPNFTDPKWQAAHGDKELLNAIENGVKGTAMVSFRGKLSREQMGALVKYIRSLNAKVKK
jgi:cytochrome c oxidase cbb3-type subunit III